MTTVTIETAMKLEPPVKLSSAGDWFVCNNNVYILSMRNDRVRATNVLTGDTRVDDIAVVNTKAITEVEVSHILNSPTYKRIKSVAISYELE